MNRNAAPVCIFIALSITGLVFTGILALAGWRMSAFFMFAFTALMSLAAWKTASDYYDYYDDPEDPNDCD